MATKKSGGGKEADNPALKPEEQSGDWFIKSRAEVKELRKQDGWEIRIQAADAIAGAKHNLVSVIAPKALCWKAVRFTWMAKAP